MAIRSYCLSLSLGDVLRLAVTRELITVYSDLNQKKSFLKKFIFFRLPDSREQHASIMRSGSKPRERKSDKPKAMSEKITSTE
jgi:hypothetical protein